MNKTPVRAQSFRTLDLNLLRVLDEVMAERSLTRAAHNLSLTQPAVSNALRRLRETLGDDLVRRDGHGIAPTAFALTLWPHVRQALDQLQSALVPQQFIPAESRNAFVLAMADATAAELMGGLGQELERLAPKVSIRVLPLTTRHAEPHPIAAHLEQHLRCAMRMAPIEQRGGFSQAAEPLDIFQAGQKPVAQRQGGRDHRLGPVCRP